MKRERIAARPMPVDQSIHWKPLRDAHYVVASLEPADGGRRKIFVRQRVLARVEALARAAHGRRIAGLLIGRPYQCSDTGVLFQVIESLAEHPNPVTDDELAEVIQKALATATRDDGIVLGWYSCAPIIENRLSGRLAYIRTKYFTEAWQTTLVVGEGPGSGGAFFLYDTPAARWFYAPFYELPDHAPKSQQPKPTCITWPQYMTVDKVVVVHVDQLPAPTPAPLERAIKKVRTTISELKPEPAPNAPSGGPDSPTSADPIRPTRPEKAPPRADRKPNRVPPRSPVLRAKEFDDTVATDPPERFIELARSDGFFVAAKFSSAVSEGAERLWVLNDPYAGILLTVVSTDTQVLDASLHYNLHTDEEGLQRAPFPEHRDLASQTIYVRETCVDQLRERCRLLRATNALEREWKVSPTIYLLTPGEWRSEPLARGDPRADANAIHALNRQRIDALPEAVREQFRLSAVPDRTT